ncbi:hypothetical protein Q1695_006305 [Nippostrongylus brasiliensis]|nr:hypothetical protein Q1695_006305 [Nippostrongylus brasiliensis]
MAELNWRDQSTLEMESDISDIQSDRGDGDTSATMMGDMSPNKSILEHENRTPIASRGLEEPWAEVPAGRLSLSQPELPSHPTPPARLNMSTGNLSSGTKPPRPPLSKTLEENKELKKQIVLLKSQLNVEKYKVTELTSLQKREVKDILEEYYSLQLAKYDVDEERQRIVEERRQFKLELDAAEVHAQTQIEDLQRKLAKAEKAHTSAVHQIEDQKEKICALEAELARLSELPSMALKDDDSDWTLQSEGDIIAEQLRKQLNSIERENEKLRKANEEQKKLLEEIAHSDATSESKKIDQLETRLREEEEERNKTSSALVTYMSRCHSLEKKIRNANLSCTNVSFTTKNKTEVLRVVESVRGLLVSLCKQNKDLRKECAALLGVNDGDSPNSTAERPTAEKSIHDASTFDKSRLLAEDLEKKQQEIFDRLKTLAENVDMFDNSVLGILQDIESEADVVGEDRQAAGVVVAEVDNQVQFERSLMRSDPHTTANLSMMNASIVELMNRSLNTSKDVAGLKDKLLSLRGVTQQMFENLRSSGVLFEDILEVLGSGTEEMRNLAARIRAMKLDWQNAMDEKHVFMGVIEETVHSVSKLQMELSAWEQSLNETSFRLDLSMAHTATTQCYSAPPVQIDLEQDKQIHDDNLAELRTLISAKEEEIKQLHCAVEEAVESRNLALSSADDLRSEINEMETRLLAVMEERDQFKCAAEASEAEHRRAHAAKEDSQREVGRLRKEMEVTVRKLSMKDALVTDVEAKLNAAMEECATLKEDIAGREFKLQTLSAALDEEQERRQKENSAWKEDLESAKETSTALYRDLEKIRDELHTKEEAVRYLQDKLRISEENNVRMAEVISGYVDEGHREASAGDTRTKAAAEVQTTRQFAKVKSREAQTDMTREFLAQMECDAVSFTSELKRLRSAHMELRDAIAQLVVKDVEPLPLQLDVATVEKSCKELSRYIHHERRRREKQATEIADTTSKIEQLRKKGTLWFCSAFDDIGGGSSKSISANEQGDGVLNDRRYDDPMRQTLFLMTSMAMELVKKIRQLSALYSAGKKINFTECIEMGRRLRNELNDRLLIVRSDEENESKKHCVPDLIHMVKILERDNRSLHECLKSLKAEYEALEKKNSGDPELAERIASQLRSIHAVMGEFKRNYGILQDTSNTANAKRDAPAQ